MAFVDERGQLRDELRDARRVLGLAFDDELVPLRLDVDVEERFEVAEVFVVRPEERLDGGLGDRNLAQRSGGDSRISLYYSYLPDAIVANGPHHASRSASGSAVRAAGADRPSTGRRPSSPPPRWSSGKR